METLAQLRASMESQVRKSTSAAQKKDDEINAREVLLSTHKEHLKKAQASAQHATDLLRTAQDAEGRSKEREEESAKSADSLACMAHLLHELCAPSSRRSH